MSIFIYHEDYTGPRYTYGLVYRPAARFNIPDGFIIGSQGNHPNFKSFGTIDYPAPLSQEEVSRFELVLVSEPEETEEEEPDGVALADFCGDHPFKRDYDPWNKQEY